MLVAARRHHAGTPCTSGGLLAIRWLARLVFPNFVDLSACTHACHCGVWPARKCAGSPPSPDTRALYLSAPAVCGHGLHPRRPHRRRPRTAAMAGRVPCTIDVLPDGVLGHILAGVGAQQAE